MSEQTASLQEPLVVSDAEVSFEIRRHINCKVEVLATVSPAFSQRQEQIAIEQLGKQVSIPGFRKGKVPAAAVKRNFADQVERRWQTLVVSGLLAKLHEHEQLAPYDKSAKVEYALKNLTLQDGGTVVLGYETQPDYSACDLTAFEIPNYTITEELKQQALDQAIDGLKLMHAEWTEITDPVSEEHFIDVDMRHQDEELFAQHDMLMQDRRIRVKDAPEHFRKAILGLKAGEEAVVASLEENGHPVVVKVLAVLLPDLSTAMDAVIKQAGFESEDALRDAIAQSVPGTLEMRVLQEREMAVRRQIAEKLNVEVPMSLIDQELRLIVGGRIDRQYTADKRPSQDEVQAMLQQAMPEAVNNIRLVFLGRKLLRENKISMNEEKLNQMLQHEVAEYVRVHGEPSKQEEVESVINFLRGSVFSKGLRRGAVTYIESVGKSVDKELVL